MVQIVKGKEPNRVAELFTNRTVLITGASGFVGKVLVEKLLRTTDVARIYVIMRPKKGKDVQERLQEIFDGPLYELLKKQKGKVVFEKVAPICGNMEEPDLGISPEDRKTLTQEVEFIYHSAATVHFDEPLKKTVLLNVRGTKCMLDLAKQCPKLMAFCYLSTAYCQENQKVLEEKTYPAPSDAQKMIELCEWINEATLDKIAKKIRGWSANNYTFTKALAESLVAKEMDHMPVFIVRPSAIVPILADPLPGWTDNINGPVGLLMGAGKGLIRTMYGRSDYYLDYVPVDFCASGLLCSTFDFLTEKVRKVYHLTSSDEVRFTFQQVLDVGRTIITKDVAFNIVLWYPNGSITTSRAYHYFRFFMFQLLPAFLIDGIFLLLGMKPFLVRVQKKIFRGYAIFEYYANREWHFRKDGTLIGRGLLNSTELEVYPVTTECFEMYSYFKNAMLGTRRYLRNEKDEDIPMALRRMKIMWVIDKVAKFVIVFAFFYYFLGNFF